MQQSWYDLIVSGSSAGISFGAALYLMRWLAQFIAARTDQREARIDDRTEAIFARMEGEITDLRHRVEVAESELSKCQEKHLESENELARLRVMVEKVEFEK